MPKAYFEPKTLAALGEVLKQAKAILERTGDDTPMNMDWVARRILELAAQGQPPEIILSQILTPLSPAQFGLKASEICLSPTMPLYPSELDKRN